MKQCLSVFLLVLISNYSIAQILDVEGDIKVDGRITNVSFPFLSDDAATKSYVDLIFSQVDERNLLAGLYGTVQDIDGNTYRTIKIGNQIWMADNLKTTKFNDGTPIDNIVINGNWTHFNFPGYSWYQNDSTTHSELYGAIYNFYAVSDTTTKNVCPVNWEIPTRADWTELNDYLTNTAYGYQGSGSDIAKSVAVQFRWDESMTAGHVGNEIGSNNSSKFSLIPGGFRSSTTGEFFENGRLALYWSSTEDGTDNTKAFRRGLSFDSSDLVEASEAKLSGFSVRCIREILPE